MKIFQLTLLIGFLLASPCLLAQDSPIDTATTTSPGATSEITVDVTSPDNTSATSIMPRAKPAEQNKAFNWNADVFGPLARLLGIVVVLGLFLWWLELPTLLKRDAWTDRTVIAFIIIFTFCASALINVEDRILSVLKDITAFVTGFYFGSAKGNDVPKPPTPPEAPSNFV